MANSLMGTNLTPQQLDYVKFAQASGNALLYFILITFDIRRSSVLSLSLIGICILNILDRPRKENSVLSTLLETPSCKLKVFLSGCMVLLSVRSSTMFWICPSLRPGRWSLKVFLLTSGNKWIVFSLCLMINCIRRSLKSSCSSTSLFQT